MCFLQWCLLLATMHLVWEYLDPLASLHNGWGITRVAYGISPEVFEPVTGSSKKCRNSWEYCFLITWLSWSSLPMAHVSQFPTTQWSCPGWWKRRPHICSMTRLARSPNMLVMKPGAKEIEISYLNLKDSCWRTFPVFSGPCLNV